jgi:hypothetical protein
MDGNPRLPTYSQSDSMLSAESGNLTPLDGTRCRLSPSLFDTTQYTPAIDNMMRQQLLRSLPRSQRLASVSAARAFTSSAPRPAEVELTIGTPIYDSNVQWQLTDTRMQMARRSQ